MKKEIKKVIKITVICLVSIFAIVWIYNYKYNQWISNSLKTPVTFYYWKHNDPFITPKQQKAKAWVSRTSCAYDPEGNELWLYALSCLSKDSKIIYEIKGLLDSLSRGVYTYDDSLLQYYRFISYDRREIAYFCDYENEIIPRAYSDIYEPSEYVQYLDFGDGNDMQHIGLMQNQKENFFKLFDIFFPYKYYREYSWDQNKYIMQYEFLDKKHILITYLDAEEIPNFIATIEGCSFNDEIYVYRRLNHFGDSFMEKMNGGRIVNSVRESMFDEYKDYLKYEIIDLKSYISDKSTIEDYHYQFITSARVSGNVTKETFDLLHTHWMSRDDVNEIFQTEGKFVKKYSHDGKDYEIYGYLGAEVAVFAIFNGDLLIACEYLIPSYYNGNTQK